MCNEFIKALQDKQELCNKACEKAVQVDRVELAA